MDHPGTGQEDALFRRIAGGDTAALATAHGELKTRLLFYATRLGLGWEDAQEAVADSFIAVWHSRSQLQSDEHLRKLLYVSVRNRAFNSLKAQQRYERLLQEVEPGQEQENPLLSVDIIKAEMLHQLGQAMNNLPRECRRVFELAYHDQQSPAEIARLLNMNPATVRSQKRRALQLIRDWIASQAPAWTVAWALLSLPDNYYKKILDFFAR
ncbi:MAG: sigma-70 family RNA polymerase sigma factor [Candidatus Pseudobacter hemicellulosilyticus]|uniref:Sigma-70 family RNA polymerase sigma factor n=1 Tax=Candidatus Pseudobacter hemicellulosilyticus TaxID=3121375 RepID=A0AAJ5WUW6_9BACT|nr:MAG: sigma-70 family RNA polymerase sigma factor [Pseudobacter sp.]